MAQRSRAPRAPLVGDLMTADPVTVPADAPLAVADRLIRQHVVGGLPVVDRERRLVGVLSRGDLVAIAGDERIPAWEGRPVRSLMTSPAVTIGPRATLEEAAAAMEEHGIHRLVVVEPGTGRATGIFSTTDLVRAVASRGSVGTAA